jgi:hypothetical protein
MTQPAKRKARARHLWISCTAIKTIPGYEIVNVDGNFIAVNPKVVYSAEKFKLVRSR